MLVRILLSAILLLVLTGWSEDPAGEGGMKPVWTAKLEKRLAYLNKINNSLNVQYSGEIERFVVSHGFIVTIFFRTLPDPENLDTIVRSASVVGSMEINAGVEVYAVASDYDGDLPPDLYICMATTLVGRPAVSDC